jgi:hypothetical protein
MGNETKTISVFKLSEYDAYGIYKDKKKYYVSRLIGALFDFGVLEKVKDENKHENILFTQIEISNETVSEIHDAIFES